MKFSTFFFSCFFSLLSFQVGAQQKLSKIVVYRNDSLAAFADEEWRIYANDVLTTSLKNRKFEIFHMPEGVFNLKVSDPDSKGFLVASKNGETAYFRIARNPNSPNVSFSIQLVDSATAVEETSRLRTVLTRSSKKLDLRRKNSIGLLIDAGIGFDKVSMMNTTDGDQVFLSFGGGGNFGFEYAYELSEYVGCAIALSIQSSGLTRSLDNASVNFTQGNLSISPYFIIPFIQRNSQRFRISGGLDNYLKPELDIQTDKLVNGINDVWLYKNTIGFHFKVAYEFMTSEHLFLWAGAQYNSVKYEFKSSKRYRPSTDDMIHPKGDAVFFCIGTRYCF